MVTIPVTLQATDESAVPVQHGRGTLVVTIVDVNDFEPEFPEPWSKDNPYITIQVRSLIKSQSASPTFYK